MLEERFPKWFRLRGTGGRGRPGSPPGAPLGAPPKPLEATWGPLGGPRGGLAHHLWEVTGGLSSPGCRRELSREPPKSHPGGVILQFLGLIWGPEPPATPWSSLGRPLRAFRKVCHTKLKVTRGVGRWTPREAPGSLPGTPVVTPRDSPGSPLEAPGAPCRPDPLNLGGPRGA